MNKTKTVYGIFEDCNVYGRNDEETKSCYDLEPVLLIAFGVWENEETAKKRCEELNKENGREDSYDAYAYFVREIGIRD